MRHPWLRCLSLTGLLLLAVGLLAQTWRCWGDINIDFPEELYVPWQLSKGKVLYRDIQHYYGPLSQYFHAALFYLVGPSYLAVALANFGFILADTALLYAIFVPLSELAAFAAGIAFLGFHAFQQVSPVGNYSFMAAYSEETVHGTFVWLAAVWAILSVQGSGSRGKLFLVGLLLGASVLLKPEFPPAIALSLLLLWPHLRQARSLVVLLAGALAPLVLATLLFAQAMPLALAVRSTFGAIMPLLETSLTQNPFYLGVTGFAEPWQNLSLMLSTAATLLGVMAVATLLDMGVARLPKTMAANGLAGLGATLLSGMAWYTLDLRWFHYGAWLVALVVALAAGFARRHGWKPQAGEAALAFLLLCAALALQPKVLLRPLIAGFGFYLSLPLTMAMVLLSLVTVPSLLAHLPRATGATFRLCSLGFFLVVTLQVQALSRAVMADKVEPLGSGADLMYGRGEPGLALSAPGIGEVMKRIEIHVPSQATLAVIPEGMMLNYLLRRDNPTPYMADWVGRHLFESLGGSEVVIATIAKAPPDFFVFLYRLNEVPLPGYEIAGPNGYAKDVIAWIKANYERIEIVGNDTDDFSELAYQLWKRR